MQHMFLCNAAYTAAKANIMHGCYLACHVAANPAAEFTLVQLLLLQDSL